MEEILFQSRDTKGNKALVGLAFLGCLTEHSEKSNLQSELFENEVRPRVL